MMRRGLGASLLAVGVALMILNIGGFILPIAEHPVASRKHLHKTKLVRPTYQDALQTLSAIDPNLPAEQRIDAANEIIAARIVHYWPKPDKIDPQTMHSFIENWYIAGLQRGEAWLAEKGLAAINIARLGRRDFREILAKGVGLCDTAAMAIVDYLRQSGISAKILALNGHVVAYASMDGRNYIIDPDYAVLIRNVPAPPDRSMPKILAAYREAVRSPEVLLRLEEIYVASPMKLYDIDRYQSRWKRSLIGARIIKWLVPTVLFAMGILLLWDYPMVIRANRPKGRPRRSAVRHEPSSSRRDFPHAPAHGVGEERFQPLLCVCVRHIEQRTPL